MAAGALVSLASVGIERAIDHFLSAPLSPSCIAVGAVICAAWIAPLAGWTATVALTVWCAADLRLAWRYAPLDVLVRSLIFAAEGALLCSGAARLFRFRRELERSNARQRQFVDTAAEGILVHSSSGIITYANERMNEMLAAGKGGLECRKFEDFVFPEDLPAERLRLQRRGVAIREQFDRRLRRADGTGIWVLNCSNPVFDERGEFAGVLSMMTDITERKAAETALRRSEEKFRSLFENVLEGVYQSTPDGRILAANPMLLRMLDLKSESEMNDVNISKDLYVDPKVRSRLLQILERDGSFQNVEYELRRRDGRVITVLENARVVRDAEGQVLYYEGTLTDITDRKLVEERLRQAQKTEALAGLAAGVAQDFNSIMTVITGYCELLAGDTNVSPVSRDHALQALKAAETAGMLTRQLVALNSLPSSEDKPLDISRVIRDMETTLCDSLGRNIVLRLALEEGAAVSIDRAQIEQIIVNLTTNSREAMPGGGVIEITTETVHLDAEFSRRNPAAEPGAYVRLTVRDTGLGIPPDLIHNLADPMFSMGKARVTGLGLATVHAVVLRLGGFVIADSTPGMGATFSVYLPLAPVPQRMLTDTLRGARQGETILIVEEEPLARELSREMLERLGYRVIPATNMEEAEKIAASGRRLDLLITTTTLGRGTGVDLARSLTSRRPALKVLLLSGRTDSPGPSKGIEHLRKPFSHDSLGRKVRQILDGGAGPEKTWT
ncbi:MAG TPA: PAS domain S-box protein [Bryobacteraceae bacterium]|nr:PAS domain S-box protein [Bryobacteraceae bacterium]